jgi:alpha-ketoglutarate-dependent taurine dioxygenase
MNATSAATDRLASSDLTPLIGSKVGLKPELLVEGRFAEELRRLLVARGVLVLRGLRLSDEDLLAFARTLGGIHAESGREVLTVSLDGKDSHVASYFKASQFWHIDNVSRESPNFASMLMARQLPSSGGDTEFANLYAAWEELPETEKARLEELKALHSFEAYQRCANPDPSSAELQVWRSMKPKAQPLVWRHGSGRKSLVLGSSAFEVEGMAPAEGRLLLRRLKEHASQPRYVYRHRWSLGDLVIWDNTGTMHRATPYPDTEVRTMSRIAIAGEEALG